MKFLSVPFFCILLLGIGATEGFAKKKPAVAQKGITKNAGIILARNSLIALNNANLTGNYTTFRDLSAPAFQTRNNAAQLSLIFTKIRRLNMNLAPIVLFNPVFTKPPNITNKGFLQLAGYFPTKPIQINFALTYQKVSSRWRLFGISVVPVNAAKKKK